MASKNAAMSDHARKVLMEMNRREKEMEELKNKATFNSVMSLLKAAFVIIMVAGALLNYRAEMTNLLSSMPSSASASSVERK